MATSAKPQKLEFNNVISMGISYSWENIAGEGNTSACGDIVRGEDLVKRTKNVSLDVLNLDLANAGDSVINFMANNQSKYVAGNLVDIHANGVYAGNGKLTNYSIKEGGQTNATITNLNYEMVNGGPDDEEDLDKEEDPVERSETITVSRDIKAKSYTIEHTYGISFGNEFDLVTDHPAYANDPSYASVDARLALGENEANNAFLAPIDYTDYIDFNGFVTESGWNAVLLDENCMGVFGSSSETRDYVNGNYSKTITRTIRYTGQDVDQANTEPYEIEYTMSFESRTLENDESCAVAIMEGSVTSTASDTYSHCGQRIAASDAAQSGYDKFFGEGAAKGKLKNWFNTIAPSAGITEGLNNVAVNSTTKACIPTVQKGTAQNKGVINFSFEMNNCPGEKQTEPDSQGNSYPYSESTTESVSYSKQKDCDGKEVDVTTTTISKSISANSSCAVNIDENGNFPLNETIDSVEGPEEPEYLGDRPDDNKIQSESYSNSPYQGNSSWSITYSDAINTEDCQNRQNSASGNCYSWSSSSSNSAPTPKTVTAETQNGIITETQGTNAAQVSNSFSLQPKSNNCNLTPGDLLAELQDMLTNNAPGCVTTSKSWSMSFNQGSPPSIQGTIGGIE